MINENRHKCNLRRREILDIQAITEAFGGAQTSDLIYVYNDDNALIDGTSVMESLHSAVAPETTAPVRRLIPGRNRVDAVVIDHPVHGEEEVDTTNVECCPTSEQSLQTSGGGGFHLRCDLSFHILCTLSAWGY